jgi:hypothetical protein
VPRIYLARRTPRTTQNSCLFSEAVRELTENIAGFFETLLKWDEADQQTLLVPIWCIRRTN